MCGDSKIPLVFQKKERLYCSNVRISSKDGCMDTIIVYDVGEKGFWNIWLPFLEKKIIYSVMHKLWIAWKKVFICINGIEKLKYVKYDVYKIVNMV